MVVVGTVYTGYRGCGALVEYCRFKMGSAWPIKWRCKENQEKELVMRICCTPISRFQPPSLHTFIIVLILLVTIPALLIMLYTAWEQHRAARHLAQQRLVSLSQDVVSEQRKLISGTRQLLMSMSQLPSLQNRPMVAQCQELLGNLLRPHPYYTNFGVADAKGEMYCSALPMKDRVNISDRLYFRRTLESRGFGVGEYQVGRITGVPAINFSYPFFDKQGEVDGAVFAALNLGWLEELVANHNLPSGAFLKIIDSNGRLLMQYPGGKGESNNNSVTATLYEHIRQHGGQSSFEALESDGVRRFYTYLPLMDTESDIYVAIGMQQQKLTAAVDRQFKRNLFLMLTLFFVISAVMWVLGHRLFLQRIKILTSAAQSLRQGKLGIQTGLGTANDELGYLGKVFDSMSTSLQSQQDRLESSGEELQRSNKALKMLSACNRTLVYATDMQQLLDMMCHLIVEKGEYRMACIITTRDEQDSRLEILAYSGMDNECEKSLSGLRLSDSGDHNPLARAMYEQQVVILQHSETVSSCHDNGIDESGGYGSIIAHPLQIGAQRGVLLIGALERNAFNQEEVALFEEMANDISFGIRTLKNHEKRIEAEAHIRHLAFYDPLTDLPNRFHLESKLESLIKTCGQQLSLLMININRFNEINNVIGYRHADVLLKSFGPHLAEILPRDTYIARIGGDIFAVILPGCQGDVALGVAKKAQAVSERPFEHAGLSLDVSVTIGAAIFPADGEEAVTLIRRASLAMHAAKGSHDAVCAYDPSFDQDGPRHLTMATELRRAIERGELQLYFQPKVDIGSRKITSVEALCRWHHREYGNVPPSEFIPLAERTGLIMPLTLWVLQEAVNQLEKWCSQGLFLPIAVNLSARNLYQPDLLAYIGRLCGKRTVPAHLLELELTESDLMEDPVRCRRVLDQMHDMGHILYIDDYGTGYSSLGYIKKLPMSAIKIDQSFIFDMQRSVDAVTIVKSTIAMAHELHMTVIAEGVENRELYDKLATLGCDQAQGYYIARPLSEAEFMEWLKQGQWGPVETSFSGHKKIGIN